MDSTQRREGAKARRDETDCSDGRGLSVVRLGVTPYLDGLALQGRLHGEVVDGRRGDTLVVLEHHHVFTLGRRGDMRDVLAGARELARLGVEVHHADRGGEVTYHGPGQLVVYPIVDLRRWGGGPLKYVRTLERVIIEVLGAFGIEGVSEGRPTGVWVGGSEDSGYRGEGGTAGYYARVRAECLHGSFLFRLYRGLRVGGR